MDVGSRYLYILLILVFSVYDIFAKRFIPDNGYSFVWLAIMFLLGAIIKKCEIGHEWSSTVPFIGILLCLGLTFAWKKYGFEHSFMSIVVDPSLLVSYCSPTIVLTSVFYLIIFSKIEVTAKLPTRILQFCAPGAFAAYLINDNPYLRATFIENKFVSWVDDSIVLIIGKVLVFAVLFLAISIIVDKVRQWLFKVLQIEELTLATTAWVGKIFDKG